MSDTAEIHLTGGYVALVDADDLRWLSHFSFLPMVVRKGAHVSAVHWSTENGKRRATYMHRMILGADPTQLVDHINGNPLDNRRANLRLCDKRGNARNRGATRGRGLPKGVTKRSDSNGYEARITVNRRTIYLGSFPDIASATAAYDEAAIRLHGEFARPNNPRGKRLALQEGYTDDGTAAGVLPVDGDAPDAPRRKAHGPRARVEKEG